jgi:putative sigma-54 modulation protein
MLARERGNRMDVQIKTRDLRLTDGLQDYIDDRIKKLERVEEPVVDAKLELRTERNRTGGEQVIAQFTIQTRRTILRTEEKNQDPHIAIDRAVDRMARQIRRYRDKKIFVPRRRQQARAHEPGPTMVPDMPEFDAAAELDGPTPVRRKRFVILPMDESEAIEQMELLGHDFFVFFNAEDGQINVLYRRHDGEYGVIQPELK